MPQAPPRAYTTLTRHRLPTGGSIEPVNKSAAWWTVSGLGLLIPQQRGAQLPGPPRVEGGEAPVGGVNTMLKSGPAD